MSWLNFNESLNTIKGQLSSLASGVLAEGIVGDTEDDSRRQYEITECNANTTNLKQNTTYNENNWIWESPPLEASNKKDTLLQDLRRKVDILENEKKELISSLEQLDVDHQQTTKELVTLRDNLQRDHNDLATDFDKLKKEYGDVLTENMEKTKEIDLLRNQRPNSDIALLKECEDLRSENEQLRNQSQARLKAHDDATREHEILMNENRSLKNEIDCLEKQLQMINAERGGAIRDKEELKIVGETVEETKQKVFEKFKDGKKILLEILGKEKKHLVLSTRELQGDIKKLQELFVDLVDKNQTTESAFLELQGEKIKLDSELIALQKSRIEDDAKLQDLHLQNQALQINGEELKKMLSSFSEIQTEKQALHEKYLGIITTCMEKYMSIDSPSSITSITSDEQPQIIEFANEVENLLKLLLDFKSKTEILEEEVCQITQEKDKIIAEKNFEIEKLLQNSEILSQEVIVKTQAIKDYEDECGELIKNNNLLINELQNFKNNGLQTISESNEDNMLLMESQLENANKKIEDMELIITDLENSKQDINAEVQTELDYIKRQLNITGQELSKSKVDQQDLSTRYEDLDKEKQSLKQSLEKMKTDYENIDYKYTEVNVCLESFREENEELRRRVGTTEGKRIYLENKVALLDNIVIEQKEKLDLLEEENNKKESQIHHYVERCQNAKMTETSMKLQMDTIGKELQSALELKRALETKIADLQRDSPSVEDHIRLEEEMKRLQIKLAEMEVQSQQADLEDKCLALESQVADLSQSRNEAVALLTAKHEENIKYHAEIQRLCAREPPPDQLAQKDEAIEKLNDQNKFLREKCEVMAQNLLQEQSNLQKILAEHSTSSEREQALSRELERLRVHLMEVEEMYTQELIQAEEKAKEMLDKVNEIEQREKNSNSIYTSVNIRANQQVETLQTQLQLVSNQRDELRVKISDLEDENNKQVAALTNLQFVLEQFQKDRDKDICQETERIRRQIVSERKIQDELRNDNTILKVQLEESKQGLQAATRLTDQLEKSKRQIITLKEEVSKLQEKLHTNESTYKELSAQADTKIDKTLIKNLIIGYISSNPNDQKQILKVIATVLDFSKKENDKVDLNKQQAGWLSSFLNPQGLNSSDDPNQQSLSAAFVRFLENESRPKVLPNLLSSQHVKSDCSSTSSTPPPRQSPLVLSEVVLPSFVDFGKNRNSSSILKDVLKDNT